MSVTVTEVGIGIFLYYFLGQGRRGKEEELTNLLDAIDRLKHLKVYGYPILPEPLRHYFFYIENTKTKQYWDATKEIEDIIDLGVIKKIECKSKAEAREILEKNGSKPQSGEPLFIELMEKTPHGVKQKTL